MVRVYFTFTNTGTEATSCWWATNVYAYQDGVELDIGFPEDDVQSDDDFDVDVQPGESITCSRCWVVRSESPVEIVFQTWEGVVAADTFYFQ